MIQLQGCTRSLAPEGFFSSVVQDESPKTYQKISAILKIIGPDLNEFLKSGPIAYQVKEHQSIVLEGKRLVVFDIIQPKNPAARGPSVVIAHGNRSYKESHRYQGEHLASYGFTVYLPQLPTTDQWSTNGLIIKDFLNKISKIKSRYSKIKPILVGHSFGGSAVTMAAYLGTPLSGLVLLDPAVYNDTVAKLMWDIRLPAILLGADPSVYLSKKRGIFRESYGGAFTELTIKGATHNDAQYPTMFALNYYGIDPVVTEKNQIIFRTLLTASVFSLALGESNNIVKILGEDLVKKGVLKHFYQRKPIGTEIVLSQSREKSR